MRERGAWLGAMAGAAVVLLIGLVGCPGFFVSPNSVVSLSLSPANPTVAPGATQQLTVTGVFGDSSQRDVTAQATFTTSASAVTTVSNTGMVTGVAVGTATMTATVQGVSASTTVTVSNRTITGITVSPANPSVNAGATQQFTAMATFSDGTTQDVSSSATWASSNTAAATISNTGLATAAAAGTTTISATSGGVTGSTTLTVL